MGYFDIIGTLKKKKEKKFPVKLTQFLEAFGFRWNQKYGSTKVSLASSTSELPLLQDCSMSVHWLIDKVLVDGTQECVV